MRIFYVFNWFKYFSNNFVGEKMNRGGGVPPIVTVLIIAAFLIASALVGWFIISTAVIATKQPLLSIGGSPTIIRGTPNTLYLTLRNDGTKDANVKEVILSDGSTTYTCTITSSKLVKSGGGILSLTCTFNGNLVSGKTLDGVVRTDAGEINFRATVLGG